MSSKAKKDLERPAIRRRKKEPKVPVVPVEMVRAFVALDLSREARQAIMDFIGRTRDRLVDFNWIPPQHWHLTLKFYGKVPRTQVPAMVAALKKCVRPAIPVTLSTLGAFPDLRSPRVLWVGIKDVSGRLDALQQQVDAVSRPLGFELEARKFRPHVTVARAPQGSRPVVRELNPLMEREIGATRLRDLMLYESVLAEGPPRYSVLQRFELPEKAG